MALKEWFKESSNLGYLTHRDTAQSKVIDVIKPEKEGLARLQAAGIAAGITHHILRNLFSISRS